MKLYDWIKKNELTQKAFAEKVDIYPTQLTNIVLGHIKPRLALAKKIKEATNNEVTLDDIYEPFEKKDEKSVQVSLVRNIILKDDDIKNIIKEKVKEALDQFVSECNPLVLELCDSFTTQTKKCD